MDGRLTVGETNKIMIFSPHEDDETIACAGIIRAAINNRYPIKVVMVTTGDYWDPKTRIQKTIRSMKTLGLDKGNIIYLGYGDGIIGKAYASKSNPQKIYEGYVSSQTYGFPEIGIVDYHYSKYGTHADYTGENIFNDILDVIKSNLPRHIYITSPIDCHGDHSATGIFVISAILKLKKTMEYSPIIHEYIIHKEGFPQSDIDALEPVSDTESPMDDTSPYSWSDREAIAVPDEMYASIESGNNLKNAAFDAYDFDLVDFKRFIRSDEVFWKRRMSNLAYNASVTGSSQNVITGQYFTNVNNGIIAGSPYESYLFSLYDNEWATIGESDGAWIKLSWRTLIKANRIILYDRPNLYDNIIRATLVFSDGSKIPVGPLPINGSQYIVDFETKMFDWVKLIVDNSEGDNIGLCEFEVYYL